MFARFIMDRKVVAIILGVALVLGAYLWMCVPHPESVNAPLTLSEAKARFSVLSSLPATAHDIYFARSSGGLGGGAHMLRFSAPIADCKAFVTAYCRPYLPAVQVADTWIPVSQPPQSPDLKAYRLAVEWFGVDRLQEGLLLSRPAETCPTVWIDTKAETLYSYWTD